MRSLVVILSLTLFACQNVAQNTSAIELISKEEAKTLIAENEDLIILDVRTEQEVAAGKIENAININYFDENFKVEVDQLKKESKLLIYCAAGGRSARAASDLEMLGFQKIYDLEGGYNAWKRP